RAAALDNGVPH
ncbi:hypothetical protein AB1N83_014376, partial [Pleurotus pulmonarius]